MRVMHGVEIVVEKQEGERPPILDDDAPRPVPLMRAMLDEGADPEQRQCEPADEDSPRNGIVPRIASQASTGTVPSACSR